MTRARHSQRPDFADPTRETPKMNLRGTRIAAVILALLAALTIAATPAAAKVVHHSEGSFNGSDAPEGPFGLILTGAAVDQASGDVWVLESNIFGLGKGLIDRFDEEGAYAGVQIAGTATPQGSFAFTLGSGIAVDNSAANEGDVYVADTEHGVIDRFSETGEFLCQITGREPLSLSPEELAHECNGPLGSATPDGSIAPAGLAVDSEGNLYAADNAHAVIDKFGPSGEYIEQIVNSQLTSEMGTIALDSVGNLYAVTGNPIFSPEHTVVKFKPNGEFDSVLDEKGIGVGVDPATGHVYVGEAEGEEKPAIAEYEPSGALLALIPAESSATAGLAVDGATGKLYAAELVNFSGGASVSIFGPGITVPTVTTQPATDLAETSSTLGGHLDPDAANGGGEVTECRFEYGTTTFYGNTAPCSPGPPYASPEDVSAEVSGLARASTYHFRLVAENANGEGEGADETFTTAGPPLIGTETSHVSGRNATLKTEINPFGLATTCQVQYVEDASYQVSKYASATTVPCSTEDLGAGFGDLEASATLEGLQIATLYHYRFLASNDAGLSGHPDQTFLTFGAHDVSFEILDEEEEPYTQAGGHPYEVRAALKINSTSGRPSHPGEPFPTGNAKDVVTDLPPGLIGNPSAIPTCTREQLHHFSCSGASQVGVVHVEDLGGDSSGGDERESERAVYNLVPPKGVAAELGFRFATITTVFLDARVRSDGDYGVTVESADNTTLAGVTEVAAHFWGVPADSSHDAQRSCPLPGVEGEVRPCSANEPVLKPFLANPTSCGGPLTTILSVDSWQDPGLFDAHPIETPPVTGCNKLDFSPTLEARPTTNVADSPSGLHVDLNIPQNEDPEGTAEAHLKDTKVILPPGLLVNPAAAAGLDACSAAQIGLTSAPGTTPIAFTPGPANCPDASKIGSVEVDTPLLDHPLPGAVYIARPHENPFDSLLAIYIAVNDPETGVVVKLAGHVVPDSQTGQLTTTFDENPQLPFEDFKLDFFGGAHGTLRTPPTCGTYQTTSVLTPWSAPESGPPATPSDSYAISAAPGGGNCPTTAAQEPHAPAFEAGTETPTAGAFSPFVLHLARPDGSQNLTGLNVTLPPGLTGKLAGVAECSEAQIAAAQDHSGAAEQGSPSCPAASQIGTVNVGAGAGPAPYYVQGTAYLAGPYKGAPLSVAIITPAVAGPFDLGTVVVRAALQVNPETAQITAKSDPIPTILQGIPLDVRSIAVKMDRSQFTLNPTNCERMAITGTALSALAQTASLTDPFQVGECSKLAFKPKLALSLKGSTKRTGNPALRATLTYPAGAYANIARAAVTLPKSEFLDNAHIGTVCTRVQFAADQCPPASIYGRARAITPLLDQPLEGNVYLRSSSHELPDLVAALNGQVDVVLVGRVDSVHGGLRNTFEAVPDAPVSKFTLEMQGGKKGLLQNSTNLCASANRAVVRLDAQNGKSYDTKPVVANSCKKGKKHSKRR